MIARYSASISVGSAVTFGLLFLMQHLIATGESPLTDLESLPRLDFVRVKPTVDPPIRRLQPPDDPPEVMTPPELPPLQNDGRGPMVKVSGPPAPVPPENMITGTGLLTGDQLAVVKVAPAYPVRAIARRLEGYVIVEFTVTATGTVRDVEVVEYSDRIFNRSAVEAAYKFKYKPRVIDGEAVETPGVRNKFSFIIED